MFVETLKMEIEKNRELQENVKQLQGDVGKMQDSESMKKAKDMYERARVSSFVFRMKDPSSFCSPPCRRWVARARERAYVSSDSHGKTDLACFPFLPCSDHGDPQEQPQAPGGCRPDEGLWSQSQ